MRPERGNSNSNRRKVVLVGGEDVHLRIPLAQALTGRGFDVTVFGSQSPQRFFEHDIPYKQYPLNRGIHPIDDMRTTRALRRLFSESGPDVVHAFDTKPGMLAPPVAKAAGVAGRVRTITGMGYVFSSRSPAALALRPVYRLLQRRASRAATHTIFQNCDDQAYFLHSKMVAAEKQSLVKGSGINLLEIEDRRLTGDERQAKLTKLDARGRTIITMVARLVRHKGVLEYLRAAAMVRRRFPDAMFLLIGPRASEKAEAISAADLEAAGRDVRYLGPRDDVPELLSLSDICVLPSYYREGVPRVLLEAGALGVPLVTTDMPGCREAVIDNHNGILIPPRDAGALGAAISQLIADPDQRRRMGEAAREHVTRHFTLDAVADAYADIYNHSLQQQPVQLPRAA